MSVNSQNGTARRACLASLACAVTPVSWLVAPSNAHAGTQLEEPLIDSVRTALASAVADMAPPEPLFTSTPARLSYVRWLSSTSERLGNRWRSRTSWQGWEVRRDFLQTAWYEAKRAGLDISLVLGLIEVESGFRKYAISSAGARGYMQVMPFWTRVIGDGDPDKLFHLQTNLRFGCVILRHYLDREKGDLFLALGRYNGSRGRAKYPNAVFAAQRKWLFEDKPPAPPILEATAPPPPKSTSPATQIEEVTTVATAAD